uniref:Uncharacterized protein n=1 Tax=Toxoplasma gondii COUG TaxID=1074873 RepID=A0A2G8YAF6_TOXGO|nr:hypothetical protein TGCOUG_273595 [Toxoplasma gondii COUG]
MKVVPAVPCPLRGEQKLRTVSRSPSHLFSKETCNVVSNVFCCSEACSPELEAKATENGDVYEQKTRCPGSLASINEGRKSKRRKLVLAGCTNEETNEPRTQDGADSHRRETKTVQGEELGVSARGSGCRHVSATRARNASRSPANLHSVSQAQCTYTDAEERNVSTSIRGRPVSQSEEQPSHAVRGAVQEQAKAASLSISGPVEESTLPSTEQLSRRSSVSQFPPPACGSSRTKAHLSSCWPTPSGGPASRRTSDDKRTATGCWRAHRRRGLCSPSSVTPPSPPANSPVSSETARRQRETQTAGGRDSSSPQRPEAGRGDSNPRSHRESSPGNSKGWKLLGASRSSARMRSLRALPADAEIGGVTFSHCFDAVGERKSTRDRRLPAKVRSVRSGDAPPVAAASSVFLETEAETNTAHSSCSSGPALPFVQASEMRMTFSSECDTWSEGEKGDTYTFSCHADPDRNVKPESSLLIDPPLATLLASSASLASPPSPSSAALSPPGSHDSVQPSARSSETSCVPSSVTSSVPSSTLSASLTSSPVVHLGCSRTLRSSGNCPGSAREDPGTLPARCGIRTRSSARLQAAAEVSASSSPLQSTSDPAAASCRSGRTRSSAVDTSSSCVLTSKTSASSSSPSPSHLRSGGAAEPAQKSSSRPACSPLVGGASCGPAQSADAASCRLPEKVLRQAILRCALFFSSLNLVPRCCALPLHPLVHPVEVANLSRLRTLIELSSANGCQSLPPGKTRVEGKRTASSAVSQTSASGSAEPPVSSEAPTPRPSAAAPQNAHIHDRGAGQPAAELAQSVSLSPSLSPSCASRSGLPTAQLRSGWPPVQGLGCSRSRPGGGRDALLSESSCPSSFPRSPPPAHTTPLPAASDVAPTESPVFSIASGIGSPACEAASRSLPESQRVPPQAVRTSMCDVAEDREDEGRLAFSGDSVGRRVMATREPQVGDRVGDETREEKDSRNQGRVDLSEPARSAGEACLTEIEGEGEDQGGSETEDRISCVGQRDFEVSREASKDTRDNERGGECRGEKSGRRRIQRLRGTGGELPRERGGTTVTVVDAEVRKLAVDACVDEKGETQGAEPAARRGQVHARQRGENGFICRCVGSGKVGELDRHRRPVLVQGQPESETQAARDEGDNEVNSEDEGSPKLSIPETQTVRSFGEPEVRDRESSLDRETQKQIPRQREHSPSPPSDDRVHDTDGEVMNDATRFRSEREESEESPAGCGFSSLRRGEKTQTILTEKNKTEEATIFLAHASAEETSEDDFCCLAHTHPKLETQDQEENEATGGRNKSHIGGTDKPNEEPLELVKMTETEKGADAQPPEGKCWETRGESLKGKDACIVPVGGTKAELKRTGETEEKLDKTEGPHPASQEGRRPPRTRRQRVLNLRLTSSKAAPESGSSSPNRRRTRRGNLEKQNAFTAPPISNATEFFDDGSGVGRQRTLHWLRRCLRNEMVAPGVEGFFVYLKRHSSSNSSSASVSAPTSSAFHFVAGARLEMIQDGDASLSWLFLPRGLSKEAEEELLLPFFVYVICIYLLCMPYRLRPGVDILSPLLRPLHGMQRRRKAKSAGDETNPATLDGKQEAKGAREGGSEESCFETAETAERQEETELAEGRQREQKREEENQEGRHESERSRGEEEVKSRNAFLASLPEGAALPLAVYEAIEEQDSALARNEIRISSSFSGECRGPPNKSGATRTYLKTVALPVPSSPTGAMSASPASSSPYSCSSRSSSSPSPSSPPSASPPASSPPASSPRASSPPYSSSFTFQWNSERSQDFASTAFPRPASPPPQTAASASRGSLSPSVPTAEAAEGGSAAGQQSASVPGDSLVPEVRAPNLACRLMIDCGDLLLCPRPLLRLLLDKRPFARGVHPHREPDTSEPPEVVRAQQEVALVACSLLSPRATTNRIRDLRAASASLCINFKDHRGPHKSKRVLGVSASRRSGKNKCKSARTRRGREETKVMKESDDEDAKALEETSPVVSAVIRDGGVFHSDVVTAQQCCCQVQQAWPLRFFIFHALDLVLNILPQLLTPLLPETNASNAPASYTNASPQTGPDLASFASSSFASSASSSFQSASLQSCLQLPFCPSERLTEELNRLLGSRRSGYLPSVPPVCPRRGRETESPDGLHAERPEGPHAERPEGLHAERPEGPHAEKPEGVHAETQRRAATGRPQPAYSAHHQLQQQLNERLWAGAKVETFSSLFFD